MSDTTTVNEGLDISRIAIAGIGNTEVGKIPDCSSVELQAQAAHKALADAGLAVNKVDALICHSPYTSPYFFNAESLAEYLGVDPRVTVTLAAGAIAGTQLTLASSLLLSGQATVALCVFGENAATASRGITGLAGDRDVPTQEFERAFGGIPAPAHYALWAQRYLHEYRAPVEAIGAVSMTERKHAALAPGAYRQQPMNREDYEQSRLVAWPLHVPDCAVITDGAAAFVVTTLDRARDLAQPPIRLLGIGGKSTHWQISQAPSLQELAPHDSGRTALGMAGVSIADIDVAEIYDCFSIAVLLQLEALGFCPEGQAGQYVLGGGMELGKSRCPVNTDGGLLNYAHLGGLLRVNEAVRQLRGVAGVRQVPNARIALATSIAAWVSTHYTMVLGKD